MCRGPYRTMEERLKRSACLNTWGEGGVLTAGDDNWPAVLGNFKRRRIVGHG